MPSFVPVGATKPPVGAPLNPGHPLTRGLVAYWPLGDSIARSLDTLGRYPLTPAGSPSIGLGRHGGRALVVHGTVDQVSSATAAAVIAGRTTASMSAWFYRAATTNSLPVGWSPATQNRYMFIWHNDAKIYWVIENSLGGSGPNSPLAGTGWHHLVMVYDGSRTGLARITPYVDGVGQALTANGVDPPPSLATAANLTSFSIGKDTNGSIWGTGLVEDVGVWNRCLSTAEVRELYERPYALFQAPVWQRFGVTPIQTAVPISDISAGTWTASTGTALYAMLDETPASDSDYIQSATTPSSDVAEVRVTSLTDPASSSGHVVRYRARKPS